MCNSRYETEGFACFVVAGLFEYNQHVKDRLYLCWKVCEHVGVRESAGFTYECTWMSDLGERDGFMCALGYSAFYSQCHFLLKQL